MASRLYPFCIGLIAASTCSLSSAWAANHEAKKVSAGGLAPAVTVDRHKGAVLPQSEQDVKFATIVDDYFDATFKLDPAWATAVGIHTYDSQLEDVSKAGVQKRIESNHAFLKQLEALDPLKLNKLNRLDRDLLISSINANLLSIETMEQWRHNPDSYSSGISASIFGLIKRDFAPLKDRMQSVIAREKQIPQALEAAKTNLDLKNVPRIYTEIALEQLPGIVDFFQTSVPLAFKSVDDAGLKSQFETVNAAAIASLKDYQKFLTDNKEKCDGSFALGETNYRKKLAYEDMVEVPIPTLLELGYRELHRLQSEFVSLAAEIDPHESPQKVFESISSDHPKPDQLLQSTRDVLEEIRTFCVKKNIVTIPSEERVLVEESPAFMRALSFASMDTPGPFETKAREAYYHETLPEPNWSKERVEEHLRSFSYPDLINTSVHEAYPGHYVQFLWAKQAPSKVRKLIGCTSNEEGWAHYCEQMMLDEGFHGDDKKLRLVQLHDALLRACRYIVGIEMHCRTMNVEQGIKFFMKEGYVEKANAERETKRGTMDPTYLVYTLGKLDILRLRDDYRLHAGSKYSLKGFHDKFLGRGFPPLKIVKAEMLDLPLDDKQNMRKEAAAERKTIDEEE